MLGELIESAKSILRKMTKYVAYKFKLGPGSHISQPQNGDRFVRCICLEGDPIGLAKYFDRNKDWVRVIFPNRIIRRIHMSDRIEFLPDTHPDVLPVREKLLNINFYEVLKDILAHRDADVLAKRDEYLFKESARS